MMVRRPMERPTDDPLQDETQDELEARERQALADGLPPSSLDNMMFSGGGAGRLLPQGDDGRGRLNDLATIEAILRKAIFDLLQVPAEGEDVVQRTTAILTATGRVFLGQDSSLVALEGWNTPDREGRYGLVEWLRGRFALQASEPPEMVPAAVLAHLFVDNLDLANRRQAGENVDDATTALFQSYAMIFVGIDPEAME